MTSPLLEDDECIGYSRAAGSEANAQRQGGIVGRFKCAIMRSHDGRRISFDRLTAAKRSGCMDDLVATAHCRHARDPNACFKGWWCLAVSAIHAHKKIAMSVVPVRTTENLFHSEVLVLEDLRNDPVGRNLLADTLYELGRWKSRSAVEQQ